MPFESLAQEGYMHAHPEILGKKGLTEWDAATKGKHLPHKVKSYKDGTAFVPETGLAIVHKGEAILTRGDIMSSMADLMGGVTKAGQKVVQSPTSEAAGIKAKADNVKEYMDAVAQKPAPSTPAPAPGVSADRINKHAKFGDRGGEKRIDVSSMTKPLVSYKTGTANVPKTGPAMLHKGEAVIPSESNPMNAENWAGKIVDSGDKPPKKLDFQKVRKAKTGGHIIEHHHTHPGHHPMEEHVKANVADMAQHMTDSNNDPSGAGDPAAGAAAAAAAASSVPALGAAV